MFKIPKKTSVYKIEPNPEKHTRTMFFAPELIKFIKDKRKYRTYRFGEKYAHLKPGDEIVIKENGNDDLLLPARIKSVTKTTFKDLPYKSEFAHESAKSKERQRQVMSGYYAYLGREIHDDDEFLVLDFELLD